MRLYSLVRFKFRNCRSMLTCITILFDFFYCKKKNALNDFFANPTRHLILIASSTFNSLQIGFELLLVTYLECSPNILALAKGQIGIQCSCVLHAHWLRHLYSGFDKGFPTDKQWCMQQCQLVISVVIGWRFLIEVHGVSSRRKRKAWNT